MGGQAKLTESTTGTRSITWLILRSTPWWVHVFVLASAFQWVFFTWAADYIDTAIVTAIFEVWPVLFLLVRRFMLNAGTKIRASMSEIVLTSIAGLGLFLVIFSESGGSEQSWRTSSITGLSLAGIALVLTVLGLAAILTTGESIARASNIAITVNHVVAVLDAITRTAAGFFLIAWWLLAEQEVSNTGNVARAAFLGVALGMIHGLTALTFIHANRIAESDTINTLYYTVPALAIVWLWVFTDVSIANLSMFICGAIGVITLNIVIHLDPEGTRNTAQSSRATSGLGFQSFVIALWASGSMVVLRDDWLPKGMLAWGFGEFWGMAGIAVTVFVLILSFRQSRLTDSKREADKLVLSANVEIDNCHYAGIINTSQRQDLTILLATIDSASSMRELAQTYFAFRRDTLLMAAELDDPEAQQRLRSLVGDVEVIVNLRQQGRDVTEPSVLALFAGVIVFLTLLFRPEGISGALRPWEGFGVEVVSMTVAAAVGFLLFDLLERRRLLDRPLLWEVSAASHTKHRQPYGHRLALLSYSEDRYVKLNRVLALALGVGVIIAFTLLLAHKWTG